MKKAALVLLVMTLLAACHGPGPTGPNKPSIAAQAITLAGIAH